MIKAILFVLMGLSVFNQVRAGNFLSGPKNFYNLPQKLEDEQAEQQSKAKNESENTQIKSLKVKNANEEEIRSDDEVTEENESLYKFIRAFCRARSK
jgi:hypothetical protein